MVDPKFALIAAGLALYAIPALAQDDPQAACDHCDVQQADLPPASYREPAPRIQSERRVYVARTEQVTRTSYSEGYLSWPGKESGGEAAGFGPQYGPDQMQCPPVRPGERVISCRYVPLAQQGGEANIAQGGGVIYADGGVGPEYIAGGGGGGGTTIIEGGNASASSSASASASASASVSININDHLHNKPPKGGGYPPSSHMPPPGGGYWPPGSMKPPSGGGSWPSGSMPPSGGGSWGGGSMASNNGYGSWPSGGAMHSGYGGVGGGHSAAHTASHGHGRR